MPLRIKFHGQRPAVAALQRRWERSESDSGLVEPEDEPAVEKKNKRRLMKTQ